MQRRKKGSSRPRFDRISESISHGEKPCAKRSSLLHSLSGILQDGLLDGVGTARIRAKVRGLLGILIACMLGGFYRKRNRKDEKTQLSQGSFGCFPESVGSLPVRRFHGALPHCWWSRIYRCERQGPLRTTGSCRHGTGQFLPPRNTGERRLASAGTPRGQGSNRRHSERLAATVAEHGVVEGGFRVALEHQMTPFVLVYLRQKVCSRGNGS